jgi:hypothetical protein
MSAPASDSYHFGCEPPDDARERADHATAFFDGVGERGRAADVAAFMWGVLGMDVAARERAILARWPGLPVRDQMRATELFRRIRDADDKKRRSATG